MGVDGKTLMLSSGGITHQEWPVSLHAYSDLTNVSPVVFLYLLKECYVYGTCKATAKFFALQHQVHQALHKMPKPGPAVFVARCISLLPIFESHCEGFSHLMLAALRRLLKTGTTQEDLQEAKFLATQLFVIAVRGSKIHDNRILVKMLEVFNIKLTDIKEVLFHSDAELFISQFISKLLESESYMMAVTLLIQLSIHHSDESFLHEMLEKQEYRAAEKWAAYMGKPMLCVLIQGYVDRKLIKQAYELIKKNNLREEFPEVYQMGKERHLQLT